MKADSINNVFTQAYVTSYTGLMIILLTIFLYLNGRGILDLSKGRAAVDSISAEFPRSGGTLIATSTAPTEAILISKEERALRNLTELGIDYTDSKDKLFFRVPLSRVFQADSPRIRAEALPELQRLAEWLKPFVFRARIVGSLDGEAIGPAEQKIAYAQSLYRLFSDTGMQTPNLDVAAELYNTNTYPEIRFWVKFRESSDG